MAQVKVTVNGRPIEYWIEEEQNQEIQQFYASELAGMRRVSRRPILSRPVTHVTRSIPAANNSVRFL